MSRPISWMQRDLASDGGPANLLWSQVVIHELRERVAVVKGYCGMLQPGPDLPTMITRLDRAVTRMERLTEDLTELSRVEAGQLTLKRHLVDVSSICRDVAEEQALTTGRYLTLDLPEEPVVLSADPERLDQLITNLVINGHHHCPYGSRVTVSLRREGAVAVLSVIDNCPGMAADKLPHVFDPLYQVNEGRASSGVGLYLCKLLVEAHQGQISVQSEPGMGCTFQVQLPIPLPLMVEPARHAGA